jgi:hypothetical protein
MKLKAVTPKVSLEVDIGILCSSLCSSRTLVESPGTALVSLSITCCVLVRTHTFIFRLLQLKQPCLDFL